MQSVVAVGALLSVWVVKAGFPLGGPCRMAPESLGTTVFLTQG